MDQSTLPQFGDGRLPSRFWKKINVQPNGCWQWTAGCTKDGYGRYSSAGETLRAHRVSYMTLRGSIAEGLLLDHLCRNRACVNPVHLEPVTNQENVRRGEHPNGSKTHCLKGHEFTPDNTYLYRGHRRCVLCRRSFDRDYKKELQSLKPRIVELETVIAEAVGRLKSLQSAEPDTGKAAALYEIEMRLRFAAGTQDEVAA